ncbi:IQ motif and SEC7 domain-containing protein 2 [Bagarius yarrelli]|uniref:IQ motif and SEC7 domain-containing protein 2 n=1 Tax=Bagarius yarrelli TaxID=175774 RepID=A0A556VX90_BAGYA|nr:IQ motif and SEC7 domain-containing protein 2 [Bagarius yarrelli]
MPSPAHSDVMPVSNLCCCMSRAGKRGRRTSAGSLDSNMEGSIISGPPQLPQRSPSVLKAPPRPRHSSTNPSSSSTLLGSLFGSKRGKPPPRPPLPAPVSSSHHLTLISHKPHPTDLHHTAQVHLHTHRSQHCSLPQSPPPYQHHHHYDPPPVGLRFHRQHSGHVSMPHRHPQLSHNLQHQHHQLYHHHQRRDPQLVPASASCPISAKPKHCGISTVV